jgi:glycolate dehydrogenase FAD-binding subunit
VSFAAAANAAGFDFPKLLVGSCGRLGTILELTFKVFPAPQATLTAEAQTGSLSAALQLVARLTRLPLDLDALEIEPGGRIVARLAGDAGTLEPRLERLNRTEQVSFVPAPSDCWARWAAQKWIKVPLTPARIPSLDTALDKAGIARRYSVAGMVAWIDGPAAELDGTLASLDLAGLAMTGHPARLGAWRAPDAEALVARVLDPEGKFAAANV